MRKHKKLIALMIILSVITSSGLVAPAKAASITNAFDRLDDSHPGVTTKHNITYVTHSTLAVGESIKITLPVDFSAIAATADFTCPNANFTKTLEDAGQTAVCTAINVPLTAPATSSIEIANIVNPNTEASYKINLATYNGASLKEKIDVMVAIISNVSVFANVPSTLTFTILPLATSTDVNGATTTAASATTSIDFGNLIASTTYSHIIGQELRVITNANYGFKVTVEQDQDLTSNTGSNIDSFQDGTAPVAPIAWTTPLGQLDVKNTYGHMGFTTDDGTLSNNDPYGNDKWMGFTGSTTQEVMYHTGAADGLAQDKGMVKVAYRIQISPLQEAGDYANVLTYVATPTY
jgi:hypothetical protein